MQDNEENKENHNKRTHRRRLPQKRSLLLRRRRAVSSQSVSESAAYDFFEAPKGVSPSPSPPPLQLCRPAGPSLTPAAVATIARNESPLSTRGRRKERERLKKAAKRRFMALKGVCWSRRDGSTGWESPFPTWSQT